MRISAFILFFSFLFTAFIGVPVGNEWKKEKEKDGIIVFSRTNEISKIKELKAVAVFHSSLSVISAIILDVENRSRWFESCESVEIINITNQGEYIYHLKIDSPFPVEDRDIVQEIRTEQDHSSGIVTIQINSIPEYIREEENYIRLILSQGKWSLRPLEGGNIEVIHIYLNDPGGHIPAGLYNLFIRERPYQIMMKIKSEVEEGSYGDGLEWVID